MVRCFLHSLNLIKGGHVAFVNVKIHVSSKVLMLVFTRRPLLEGSIILDISQDVSVNKVILKQKTYRGCNQGDHCLWNLPIGLINTTRWKETLVPCDKRHRSQKEEFTNHRNNYSATIWLTAKW